MGSANNFLFFLEKIFSLFCPNWLHLWLSASSIHNQRIFSNSFCTPNNQVIEFRYQKPNAIFEGKISAFEVVVIEFRIHQINNNSKTHKEF